MQGSLFFWTFVACNYTFNASDHAINQFMTKTEPKTSQFFSKTFWSPCWFTGFSIPWSLSMSSHKYSIGFMSEFWMDHSSTKTLFWWRNKVIYEKFVLRVVVILKKVMLTKQVTRGSSIWFFRISLQTSGFIIPSIKWSLPSPLCAIQPKTMTLDDWLWALDTVSW